MGLSLRGAQEPCQTQWPYYIFYKTVASTIGHGVIQPFQWLMSTHTGSPKPPKTETYPKIENWMNLDYMQEEYPSALFCT